METTALYSYVSPGFKEAVLVIGVPTVSVKLTVKPPGKACPAPSVSADKSNACEIVPSLRANKLNVVP